MKIIFDTLNSYYLPQYLPVYHALKKRGHQLSFVCYKNKDDQHLLQAVFDTQQLAVHWLEGSEQARDYYLQQKADWIFFGNGISYIEDLNKVSFSAQLGHGIGPKPSYYNKSSTPMTVRFIEGDLRLKKIREMYPAGNFAQVGYSKLDPLISGEQAGLDFAALGLDKDKATILYAPTFNPSSLECFPNNWPKYFPDFNILIKAHSLTYTRDRYRAQRNKLKKWSAFLNVYVAKADELSLLPFMHEADILLSEASSTLFEFVALDKPVIVCDFFKLKWSYRGPFRYRFEQRFGKDNVIYRDIGMHVRSFKELKKSLPQQLAQPEQFRDNRKNYTRDHVGPMDGKASERIADYIEKYSAEHPRS